MNVTIVITIFQHLDSSAFNEVTIFIAIFQHRDSTDP